MLEGRRALLAVGGVTAGWRRLQWRWALVRQVARIFAMLRSHCDVMKTNFMDNYVKAQRDHILKGLETWVCNAMCADAELLQEAAEGDPAQEQQRGRCRAEIAAMEKCERELQKCD